MELLFGEYLPDMPVYKNPGCTVARNVTPSGQGYKTFPSQVIYSNALTARCQGAFSTKDADGNTVNFAGDITKLYRMSSAAYADVSKVGGYSTSSDEMWRFTRFSNFLIATNFTDSVQVFTVNSSSNFADLSGSPPKARYIATVRNFIVVGNTNDAIDGAVPHRVRWSGLNDSTAWTVSATTQADYDDLDPSNGWVRGVVGGEHATIFQERAISLMAYQGSPTVWRFDEVESGKGTLMPGSIVKVGAYIAYIGLNGFYIFDGSQSVPIGTNKVDSTFLSEVDANYFDRVCVTAHPDIQIIVWAVPVSGNTNGRPNKLYLYNYSPNAKVRWATIENIDIEFLYTSLSEGYTLDSLDTISTNLDALLYSLDSRVWTGENYVLSGFDSNHKQINFTGTAMSAVLETAEFQLFPGSRADITLVSPIVEGSSSTVSVQMGARDSLTSTVSYGAASSTNSSGNCPVRSNARYQRIRVNISSDFNYAQGVEILNATDSGER